MIQTNNSKNKKDHKKILFNLNDDQNRSFDVIKKMSKIPYAK